jgi:hypothetical protein
MLIDPLYNEYGGKTRLGVFMSTAGLMQMHHIGIEQIDPQRCV